MWRCGVGRLSCIFRRLHGVGFLMSGDCVSSIVLVNDEAPLRKVVTYHLERQGYGVRAYAHGADALDAYGSRPCDLVITDVTNFPMHGVEFVRRLREFDHSVAVIILSARASEVERELRGTGAAADDYITCPFMSAELVSTVRRVLEKR